jgi:hypothetical protein
LSDIEEMVEEAKKPGKFNIVEAVKGRAYPQLDVEVFIDEDAAYVATQIESEIKKVTDEMDSNSDNEELKKLTESYEEFLAKKNEIIESMGGSRYVFHLQGISEGVRNDLYDKALEKFPMKYETDRNPLTGESTKKEIEDEKRNKYFTDMLWSSYILKITAPDGSEQDGISVEDASELRRSLPIASASKITDAIEKMRVATAVFMLSVDEDFLAKS